MAAHRCTLALTYLHISHPRWLMRARLVGALINGVPRRAVPEYEAHTHTQSTDLGQMIFK